MIFRATFCYAKTGLFGVTYALRATFIVLFWLRKRWRGNFSTIATATKQRSAPLQSLSRKQKFVTTFNLFFKIALFLTHLVYCFSIYRTRVFLRVIVCIFPSETSLFHRLVIRNIFRLRSLAAALNRIKNLFPFGSFLY